MIVKIDEDGQIKLPKKMMEKIQASPGDELEVIAAPDWLTVSRRREKPLHRKELDLSKLKAFHAQVKRNHGTIEDLDEVRMQTYLGSPLRD